MKTIEKNIGKIPAVKPPANNRGIRVRQFSLEGEYIATYDSIYEAYLAIGTKQGCGINNVILGKTKTWKGFQWVRAE